ncbi:hypothetical protein B0O79_3848 [Flavobacteriaceae bacterium MAR_2009_75]|nr:hypothetical protein B0O79_3848 [Flavobacteriaceae bacterium MAR_2009_75]
MDGLINYILEFGQLNTQQIKLIKRSAHEITLHKGAYFSEAGKIPNQVAFVIEGVFRRCYYNYKGEGSNMQRLVKMGLPENSLVKKQILKQS